MVLGMNLVFPVPTRSSQNDRVVKGTGWVWKLVFVGNVVSALMDVLKKAGML